MPDALTQRDLENEARLVRIEEKVDETNRRIDEALLTQIKDHGKRIAALERRQTWSNGWVAGAAGAASALTAAALHLLGLRI